MLTNVLPLAAISESGSLQGHSINPMFGTNMSTQEMYNSQVSYCNSNALEIFELMSAKVLISVQQQYDPS